MHAHEAGQPCVEPKLLPPQAYWITNDPSDDLVRRCADTYGVHVMPYAAACGGHREAVLRYLRQLQTQCARTERSRL